LPEPNTYWQPTKSYKTSGIVESHSFLQVLGIEQAKKKINLGPEHINYLPLPRSPYIPMAAANITIL